MNRNGVETDRNGNWLWIAARIQPNLWGIDLC
jgi:hypothetical protein